VDHGPATHEAEAIHGHRATDVDSPRDSAESAYFRSNALRPVGLVHASDAWHKK